MLRDLTIKNYRCFKDFSIDGLARVNLIVGQNNSGKTSFLEAVYLLTYPLPFALFDLLRLRGEGVERTENADLPMRFRGHRYEIQHIFHGYEPLAGLRQGTFPTLSLASSKDQPIAYTVSLDVTEKPKFYTERDMLFLGDYLNESEPLELTMIHQHPSLGTDAPLKMSVREDHTVSPSYSTLGIPHQQFVPADRIALSDLAKVWDSIALSAKEEQVLEALRIIDPTLEGVHFTTRLTANSGVLVKLKSRLRPIPLGSVGAGMRRLLTLATSAVAAESGTLLIDEIDTGLHFSAQTDMWRMLIDVANRLDVQIFATTHSWDCIAAFHEALSQTQVERDDLGLLFRLQEREGDIIAVDYDLEKLDVAIDHMIEVR